MEQNKFSKLTIQRLVLHHWRNYEEMHLDFSEHFNQIIGANAQGKTNLLEAIQFLISGRSFRTHHLNDLIRDQQPRFYIEAHFLKQGIEQKIKVAYGANDRKIVYNSTPLGSLSDLIGIIPGVLLAPQDDELVRGSPQYRRDFLDLHIAQVDPLYVHHLTRYQRALKQRNHLLKQESTLCIEMWEHEMAKAAAYLVLKRYEAVVELELKSKDLLLLLSEKNDELSIIYQTSLSYKLSYNELVDAYIAEFQKQRRRELIMGFTLIGPQKDDLNFLLNGKEARLFASEGQARTLVSALRFAQWHRLSTMTEEKPLMIIDDIGMSLDPKRKTLLLEHLQHLGQVFVSSPEPHSITHTDSRHYSISGGKLFA
ncbi:MAG: DNA replication/repair protein RecF [Parachlamydiales bacterium]|nr:DNA replication/repair protein RecF [Parachlamydiales bacterium]